jgi:nitrate/TMAO reductase-like tetraheme cytochrome c subunit
MIYIATQGGMKVAYKKPKCDYCSEELIIYEEFAFTVETKINRNGIRSKKPQNSVPLSHRGHERLQCERCCVQWEFEVDEKGRIIKIVS